MRFIRWQPIGAVVFGVALLCAGTKAVASAPSDQQAPPLAGPGGGRGQPRDGRNKPPKNRPTDRRRGQRRNQRNDPRRFRVFDDWSREEIAEVSKFVRQRFPEMARMLRNLEQSNQREFELRMREVLPRMMRLMRTLRQDEEIGELGVREEQLHIRIHRSVMAFVDAKNDRKRKTQKEQVQELVTELFEVRQHRAELTMQRLEERLQKLKHQMETREAEKDELIAHEVDRRLHTAERFPLDRGPGRDLPLFGPTRD